MLRELCAALGVKLPVGHVRLITPGQAALLEFCARHPFCEFMLEVRAGEPYMASAEWEDGVKETFALAGDHRDPIDTAA